MERNNIRLSGNVQNVGNKTRFEKIALSNEDMEYIGSSGAISVFFFNLFFAVSFSSSISLPGSCRSQGE